MLQGGIMTNILCIQVETWLFDIGPGIIVWPCFSSQGMIPMSFLIILHISFAQYTLNCKCGYTFQSLIVQVFSPVVYRIWKMLYCLQWVYFNQRQNKANVINYRLKYGLQHTWPKLIPHSKLYNDLKLQMYNIWNEKFTDHHCHGNCLDFLC